MRAIYVAMLGALAAACSAGPDDAASTTEPSTPCPGMGGGGSGEGWGDGGAGATGPDGGPATANADDGSTSTSTPTAPGYFHTDGAHIVDASGKTVRLTGVNWFGMETANFAPHGLWTRGLGDVLDQVKQLGFNVLRLPFSDALFDPSSVPNGIDTNKNPDLVGLTGVEIMDKVVAGAKARGIRVFLDRHRPDAGSQSPLWYTGSVSEQKWIDDWTMLAKRYANDPTVIGADLHNEPHANATWGSGDASTDWRQAAQRAGNAILAVNPNWLIIVEGVEAVGSDYYWWGGNLSGAASAPVQLAVPNRVVYSPHDYPASVYAQTWFSAPGYPANLAGVWDAHWGGLAKSGAAPVLVGEFGTRYQTTTDQQWLAALVSYIKDNGLSFTFWCLNPDSGDTGGILKDDWVTVDTQKMDAIRPALAPML